MQQKHLLQRVRRCSMALLGNLKPARLWGMLVRGLTWRRGTEPLVSHGRACHRQRVSEQHQAGYESFRSVKGSEGGRSLRSIFRPQLLYFPALLTVLLLCCCRDTWVGSPAPRAETANLKRSKAVTFFSWHEVTYSSVVSVTPSSEFFLI